jgi:hypothetical protein
VEFLHILRSAPDELVRRLVDGLSRGRSAREVRLDEGRVDYDKLVEDIFAAEKVICWW